MKDKKIIFNDEEYVLIATFFPGSPIAKEDDFRHGRPSFAHLQDDGRILRYREQIGTIDDIEIIDEDYKIEVADDFCLGVLQWGIDLFG
jgi:hypothetical protein